ncbi:MAG: 2-oxo acid dehydrogenase subunit E2 [Chloroflexi bacterium]|nr:MAG: 2-oxo acid dehydrogenase subunit E2 [Chloroflexota bacterium]
MSEVNMPKLSDTMEEGTIVEWKKSSGDEVHKGDVLAEVESDKATFDLEAESDGTLEIIVEKGVPAKIGAAIARIGAGGAAKPAEKKAPPPKAEPKHEAKAEPKQEAKPKPETVAEGAADNQASEPAPPTRRGSAAPTSPRRGEDGETAGDIKASPLAKRIADEMGVDLRAISGTGPDGRIVKEDVLAAAGGGARSERRRPESPAAPSGPEVEVIEPTRMQATIAKRMAEAKATVPIALRRFPEVNSSWVDGRFQRKRSINIGLAVPPSQGLGLLVPVVHDVDRKDLVQISIESRQVIERARSGRPGEHDLSGATFSISNLGMYGVDEFVAIINPPESAILAVGAIKDVAVVEDGRIVPGKVMRMTLSVDHRVFYGQTAAQFMAEVKRLIENPVTLVVPAS